MSIKNNLRQLRANNGMTQEQVANKAGVTRQALSSYESGRTQPDIDMLVRLSEIYGTDLDELIYGNSRVLKSMRRIKVTAIVVFVLLIALTTISSALLWSANHFFAIKDGIQLSQEAMVIFSSRQRLIGAWETIDEIILTVSLFGFLLLSVFIVVDKCSVSVKLKIAYMAALTVCLLVVSTGFGITDTVFTLTDYLITPVFVIVRLMLFGIVTIIIKYVQKRHNKKIG
jgi:transcriptional regulator with XRE-family HTH domain